MTSLLYWPCWPFFRTVLDQRGTVNSYAVDNSCVKYSSWIHSAGHKNVLSFTFLERVWSWQWIFVSLSNRGSQAGLGPKWRTRKQSALGSFTDPPGDNPHHWGEHTCHTGGVSGEKIAIRYQLLFDFLGGGRSARGSVCDANCPSHNIIR